MDLTAATRAVRDNDIWIEIMGCFAITLGGKRYIVRDLLGFDAAALVAYLALQTHAVALGDLSEIIVGCDPYEVATGLRKAEIIEIDGQLLRLGLTVDSDVSKIRHAYVSAAGTEQLRRVLALCKGQLLPGYDHTWVLAARSEIDEIVSVLRRRHDIAVQEDLHDLRRRLSQSEQENLRLQSRLLGIEAPWAHYRPVRTLAVPKEPEHAIFVGRDSEVAALVSRLINEPRRWTTITGSSGIGKSALARTVGKHWSSQTGGRALVASMCDVGSREQLYTRLTQALALGTPDTIRASVPIEHLIAQQLRASKTLLVLDGCEGLVIERLVELQMLAYESGVSILATAYRKLFGIEQQVERIGPLSRDDAFQLIMLLVARGDRKAPLDRGGMSGLVDLCGGVPRVIEIAVKMTETWPLERVVSSFRSGDHEEGSALRWLVESSLARISPEARETFAALSLFAGPFSLVDATAVLLRDIEADLAELDFIGLITEHGQDYELLPTFRALAHKALSEDLAATYLERYVHHYANLAETHARDLTALGPHVANIKNALLLALASGELFAYNAARIAMSLATYWIANRALDEGTEILSTVAAMPTFDSLPPHVRAGVLGNLGVMHLSRGQYAEAVSACERGLPAARLAGDLPRLGAIASNLAGSLVRLDREMESLPYHEEAVAALRAFGDPERLALALQNASAAHIVANSYERAVLLASEASKLMQVGPIHLRCQLNTAEALYGLGRMSESVTLARDLAQLGLMQDQLTIAAHCLWLIGIARNDQASIQNAVNYLQSAGDGPTTFALREMAVRNLKTDALKISADNAAAALRERILTL